MRILAIALALLTPLCAQASEKVVAALSQAQVAITTDFQGSEILVFGAVQREAPIPADSALDVIVTVAGPQEPVTVRRKSRRMGIWVNTQAVPISTAPSFYAVESTAPLSQILNAADDRQLRISMHQMIRGVGVFFSTPDAIPFTDALIRIRMGKGQYTQDDAGVTLQQDTLFRAAIALPANLTEGTYTTRIFLLREGQIVDRYQTSINVSKVGLERLLFNLAQDQPLIYGLLAIVLAAIAGWAASALFRYIRG